MTISEVVQSGLFVGDSDDQQLIRIPIRAVESAGNNSRRRSRRMNPPSERSRMLWTTDEHDRFLEALEIYPSGPWKVIAEHVDPESKLASARPAPTVEPVTKLLEDATEHAVLMEFVKNFQPSEIGHVNHLPYTQGSYFWQDVYF
ncbi:hypothetical protein PF005_g27248 [Phytophthora fragariae]|nr:hypothetical protein PF003_g25286 [Phytophthora fragariae]KAE8921815.1 hypothetical protein PF009_g27912 [Phytophthora fragariae]KAE9069691.1 hypothetical protein PF007_g27222 [Phytophthora fragariae]KAE9082954.1 hypothetical protein PF006_g26789 [Phytophthora fragariae]KAE9171183.1 hypothetical protein PF005_g27248 [Phytophthora fragariae]